MVEISLAYEGDLHCVSVHGPSGSVLPTDAPSDNMGRGEAFSPTDLTATSLGVCMITTMAIAAEKKSLRADLAGSRATVRKHMTAEPPRRIARIEVELTLPGAVSPEERAILEDVALNCPVALSLDPAVKKDASFHWTL